MKAYKRILGVGLSSLLITTSFAGCGTNTTVNVNADTSVEIEDENTSEVSGAVVDTNNANLDLSDYDLTDSYDESSATHITLSGDNIDVEGDGVSVDGSTVTITSSGVYVLSGNIDNGQIIVDTKDDEKVQLVLDGVDLYCEDSAPIYVKNAEYAVITLAQNSVNTLTDGVDYNIGENDENINGAIYSKEDLILNGSGSLTVNANYNNGISGKDNLIIVSGEYNVNAANHGIKGKDSIIILDGTFNVTSGKDGFQSSNSEEGFGYIDIYAGTFNIVAGNDGIQAESTLTIEDGYFNIYTGEGSENAEMKSEDFGGMGGRGGMFDSATSQTDEEDSSDSTKGLKSNIDIVINGGVFSLDTYDDGIHSDNDVTINGGEFTISTGDDGIHADNDVTINDGVIDITYCYEGIEGYHIFINGGTIDIYAMDDGLNAAKSEAESMTFDMEVSPYIQIAGGVTTIQAYGDGIDSNGGFFVDGGEVYVQGLSSMEPAIDYDSILGEITDGTVVAVGTSQMADGFMDSSTQNSMLYVLSEWLDGTDELTLTDSNGVEVVSFMPSGSYNCVVISTPDLVAGETYTLSAGSYSEEITLSSDSTVTSNSTGNNMGGGMMQNPNGSTTQGGMGGKQDFNGDASQGGQEFNGEMPQGGMGGKQDQGSGGRGGFDMTLPTDIDEDGEEV